MTTLLNIRGLDSTEPEFRAELVRVALRLGLDPSYLAAVMAFESGFDPAVRNKESGATGLIQFTIPTAKMLGTTVAELAAMSRTQQLRYVERYFEGHRIRRDVPTDYYLWVFAPAHVGKSGDSKVYEAPSKAYEQNKALDREKKGYITVNDAAAPVLAIIREAKKREPLKSADPLSPPGVPGSQTSLFSEESSESYGTLRKHDTGHAVARMQNLLGLSTIDGIFGDRTDFALRAFQRQVGLKVDGVCGPDTWKALLTRDTMPPSSGPKLEAPDWFDDLIAEFTNSVKHLMKPVIVRVEELEREVAELKRARQ